MENNFTVHIFGYGETQCIKEGVNFKTWFSWFNWCSNCWDYSFNSYSIIKLLKQYKAVILSGCCFILYICSKLNLI